MTGAGTPDTAWLDLVADLLSAPAATWPVETVIRLLVDSFDGVAGAFYQPPTAGAPIQFGWPPEVFGARREEIQRWGAEQAPRAHPLLRYYLATGDLSSRQVVDVPLRIADRRVQGAWREWVLAAHTTDVSDQLAIPVGTGPPPSTSFLVGRADRFTARELDAARRLQRVLAGLDRHLTAVAGWSRRAGAPGAEAAEGLGLTPRELTVLDLLAHGMTAHAIARRIVVSERTVHKHLQRVYAKVGVADRLAAVQRAQYLGVLAPPTYAVPDPVRRPERVVH